MIIKEQIDLEGVDVIIELTRWCNMQCPHCLRGERQKRRIKKEYIDTLLSKVDYIGTIIFTGGEPALAKDLMQYTLTACRCISKDVGNFWMATNGSVVTRSFFDTIKDWVEYCGDNDVSGLRISIDPYHDRINKYPFEDFAEMEMSQFPGFYFEYQGAPREQEYLYNEGRAKENYYGGKEIGHELHLQEDGRLEGSLYLNAKGYILSSCDISFDTADNNKDFTICHVSEDIQEKLAEWFNNHPELIYK